MTYRHHFRNLSCQCHTDAYTNPYTNTHTYTYANTDAHTYTNTDAHTYTNTDAHTYTHTYTYTYPRGLSQLWNLRHSAGSSAHGCRR